MLHRACAVQVVLFLSVLFTLRWPYAIMENVAGLLSGAPLHVAPCFPCLPHTPEERGLWGVSASTCRCAALPWLPAAAGDTMQRILQAAVSAGYQVKWRLLNTGSYGVAEVSVGALLACGAAAEIVYVC